MADTVAKDTEAGMAEVMEVMPLWDMLALRVAEVMRIGVIAEDVEEQEILARLKALNVSHAQGFGIHQPQPIDSIST